MCLFSAVIRTEMENARSVSGNFLTTTRALPCSTMKARQDVAVARRHQSFWTPRPVDMMWTRVVVTLSGSGPGVHTQYQGALGIHSHSGCSRTGKLAVSWFTCYQGGWATWFGRTALVRSSLTTFQSLNVTSSRAEVIWSASLHVGNDLTPFELYRAAYPHVRQPPRSWAETHKEGAYH